MKRDLLIFGTSALAMCLIISRLWGGPEVNTAKPQKAVSI
jgi:hypothetical protein